MLDILSFATLTIKMNTPQPKSDTKQSPLLFAIFTIFLSILLAALGAFIVKNGWVEYQLDQRFKVEGISTPATLTGYRVATIGAKHKQTGDVPLYSYLTTDGVTREHLAREYGIASDASKEILATKKVLITYLPGYFGNARVTDWYRSPSVGTLILGLFPFFLSFAFLFGAIRILIKGFPDSGQTPNSNDSPCKGEK